MIEIDKDVLKILNESKSYKNERGKCTAAAFRDGGKYSSTIASVYDPDFQENVEDGIYEPEEVELLKAAGFINDEGELLFPADKPFTVIKVHGPGGSVIEFDDVPGYRYDCVFDDFDDTLYHVLESKNEGLNTFKDLNELLDEYAHNVKAATDKIVQRFNYRTMENMSYSFDDAKKIAAKLSNELRRHEREILDLYNEIG